MPGRWATEWFGASVVGLRDERLCRFVKLRIITGFAAIERPCGDHISPTKEASFRSTDRGKITNPLLKRETHDYYFQRKAAEVVARVVCD